MGELIWFQDPLHFVTAKNYNVFFPTSDMMFVEQLNALMRMSLYFCVVVFVIKHDANIFFVLAISALFTFLMYSVDDKKEKEKQSFMQKNNLDQDKLTNEYCLKPTKNNPFMNVLMSDYTDQPERPKACDVTEDKTNEEINNAFETGLYRDVSDIFSKIASDRQYVTNPSTTIPNDREKLTNWLYNNKPEKTCKEGNGDACFNLQYSPIVPT